MVGHFPLSSIVIGVSTIDMTMRTIDGLPEDGFNKMHKR